MSDNIPVKPSDAATRVNVATDVVEDVHYPIYKMAQGEDGAIVLISEDTPLYVKTDAVTNSQILTALNELITEMKINNAYQALAHDSVLTEEDLK